MAIVIFFIFQILILLYDFSAVAGLVPATHRKCNQIRCHPGWWPVQDRPLHCVFLSHCRTSHVTIRCFRLRDTPNYIEYAILMTTLELDT